MNNKLIIEHMDIIRLNDGDNDDVLIPPPSTFETKKENLTKTNKNHKKIALQVDGQERAMVGQVRV